MDSFINTATVIGFGETGATIANLLNTQSSGIVINIMDPSSDVEGGILDLCHAAVPNENTVHWNEKKHFENSELLFYTAGVRGEKGQNRRQKAEANKSIVNQVFDGISLSKNALIISISNPVEAICHWIHQTTGKNTTVIGTGTLLDTYRLKSIIAEQLGCKTSAIQTTVIGEHGTHMIPLWSMTTVDDKPIREICSLSTLQAMTEALLNAANRIRSTQKATKYGVAQSALTLANDYFSPEKRTAAFAYLSSDEEYYTNRVFAIGNRKIKAIDIAISATEEQQCQEATTALKSTIEQ
ncbi:MAG: lactate/malate family dehydrogenase [Bacteroidota bacterium]